MNREVEYSARERFWLYVLAVVGFVPLNGVFVYGLLRPDVVTDVLTNPIAVAFIAEALVLVGVFAYLLAKWEVSRVPWWWFVPLSFLGGIAFALPIALLWHEARGAAACGSGSRPAA